MAGLGDLFGGGSTPSIDFGQLQELSKNSINRRKAMVSSLYGQLPQFTNAYQGSIGKAGKAYGSAIPTAANTYAQELSGLTSSDRAAAEQGAAQAQKQLYRNIPQEQRNIKGNLAAAGGLGRGAAINALQTPVTQAAQNLSDIRGNLESQVLGNVAKRGEAGVQAKYQAAKDVAATQFGLDTNTAQTLLDIGRGDLIAQVAQNMGLDQEELQNALGLNIAQQEQNIANAQASNARRGGIVSSLTGLGGAALGSLSGPLGAAIGGQLGLQAGGLLSGQSTAPIDPTQLAYLYLLRNKTPNVPVVEQAPVTLD